MRLIWFEFPEDNGIKSYGYGCGLEDIVAWVHASKKGVAYRFPDLSRFNPVRGREFGAPCCNLESAKSSVEAIVEAADASSY
jgi:hypothetical protein